MYLLFLEMFLALAIIVFIMWWTMKDAVKSDQSKPLDGLSNNSDADAKTHAAVDAHSKSPTPPTVEQTTPTKPPDA